MASGDPGLWRVVLSSPETILEPPERPQGSPASSSVWREDPGLLSMQAQPLLNLGSVVKNSSANAGDGGSIPSWTRKIPWIQTTQGNRLSCRDQEGRRGSEEAARGPGTLIPSAQRLVWAAKQPLGNAALSRTPSRGSRGPQHRGSALPAPVSCQPHSFEQDRESL